MTKCSSSQGTPVHKTRKRRNLHKSPNSLTHFRPVFNRSQDSKVFPFHKHHPQQCEISVERCAEHKIPTADQVSLEKESHTGQYKIYLYPRGVTSSVSPMQLKKTQQTNKLTDRGSSWKAASRWSHTQGCICNAPVQAVQTARCPWSCTL